MRLPFSLLCLCVVVAAYVERYYNDDDLYSEANDLLNPFDAEDYEYRGLLDADEDVYQDAYDYEDNGFENRMLKPKRKFGPKGPSGTNRRPRVNPPRGGRPGGGRVNRQPIGASIKGGSGRRQPGGGRKPGGPRGPGGPKNQGGFNGPGGSKRPGDPRGPGNPRGPRGPKGPGDSKSPGGPKGPGGPRGPGGNSGGPIVPGGPGRIPIPLPPPPTRVSQPPPTKTTRPPKADIQTNPRGHPIGPPRPPPPYKPHPEPIPQPPPTKATEPPKVDSPELKTCKQSFWSKLDPRKRCRGGCLHECAQELLPNGGHCDQCDERCCEYNCRGIDCISVEVKKVLDLGTMVRDFFTTTTNGYGQGDNNPSTEAPYVPRPDPPAEQGAETAETEEPPTKENTDGESNGDQEQEQGEETSETEERPTEESSDGETKVDQEQGEETVETEELPTEETPEGEANVDEEQEQGEETEEPQTDENPESEAYVDQGQEPDETGELNPAATTNDGTDTPEKIRQLEFDYVPYPQPNFDVSGFSDGEELQGDYVPYSIPKFDTYY